MGLQGPLGELQRGAKPCYYFLFFFSLKPLTPPPPCSPGSPSATATSRGLFVPLEFTAHLLHPASESPRLCTGPGPGPKPLRIWGARAAIAWEQPHSSFATERRRKGKSSGCEGLNAKQGCGQGKVGSGKRQKWRQKCRKRKYNVKNFPKGKISQLAAQETVQSRRRVR